MVGLVALLVLMVGAATAGVFVGAAVISWIVGWALNQHGEAAHEDSELVDLNR